MKNKIKAQIVILCLVILMPVMSWAAVGPNWIEQWGITWTFDKDISLDGAGDTYQYGQYANGDYWVVGPVSITGIDPPYAVVDSIVKDRKTGLPISPLTIVNDRVINGAMINPMPGSQHGYDSAVAGWDPALSVNSNVSQANPLEIDVSVIPIKSLVSTISTDYVPDSSWHPRLQTAAILTITSVAPSQNAFRPPYSGYNKFLQDRFLGQSQELLASSIDWSTLATLTPVDGVPDISTYERHFQRCWIIDKPNPNSLLHPIDNQPDYGREMARHSATTALLLNLNYTREQKEVLLIRYLQYGLDVAGVIHIPEGRDIWPNNGGIFNGRKLASVFAAKVLDLSEITAQHAKAGQYLYEVDGKGPGNPPDDFIHYGNEDGQVFYVSQLDVDTVLNPDFRDPEVVQFEVEDIGRPEWGLRHSTDPRASNNIWGTYYRAVSCCTWPGTALVGHIMDLKSIWNNDVFFDYCDRYIAVISDIDDDRPWRIGTNGIDTASAERFVWNMWHTYRADYGHVWPAGTGVPESQPEPEPEADTGTIIPDKTLLRISNNIIKSGGNSVVTINCDVKDAGVLSVKIYDSKGREIITLWNRNEEPGIVPIVWTGEDSDNNKVGSGLYMVHMECGEYKETKKIVIIK